MPKISVIIPVYKVEEYLNRCVDSVINQTYKDFEIILVDDGSPDNCGKICDEYAAKYDFITVIHKKNGGLSDARNAGLDVAKGGYVTFVDSDDYIHPEYLKILITEAEKHNADIAVCKYQKCSDIKAVFSDIGNYETQDFDSEAAICEFMNCKYGIDFIIACAKLYKRKIFENLRFPKGRIHEDNLTIWKCYLDIKNIVYLSAKLYYYYTINSNSITNQSFSLKSLDYLISWDELYEHFKGHKLHGQIADNAIWWYGRYCIKVKNELHDKATYKRLKNKIKEIEHSGTLKHKLTIKNFEEAFVVAHPIRAELYFKKVALLKRLHLKKESKDDT